MKTVIATFADSRLSRSVDRFRQQAKNLKAFDEILSFSEKDIQEEFAVDYGRAWDVGSRGFGYWAWKPWLLHKVLAGLDDDDVLVYADVGFHINQNGIQRFHDYVKLLGDSPGVLGFQAVRPSGDVVLDDGRSLPDWPDKYWAKGDLLDFFGVRERKEIIDTPTFLGGLILFKKNRFALRFLNEWFGIMRDYSELCDDSPSTAPNVRGFRENRHDQAVFALLGKLREIGSVSSFEVWMPRHWASIGDWGALGKTPFHARRDLDFGTMGNIKFKVTKFRAYLRPASLLLNLRLLVKRVVNLFRPVSQRSL